MFDSIRTNTEHHFNESNNTDLFDKMAQTSHDEQKVIFEWA